MACAILRADCSPPLVLVSARDRWRQAMKTIKLLVATDPTYYGPESGPEDVQEYATFAYEYLLRNGYVHVEIEYVERYPVGSNDTQAALRDEIWEAYRGN